MLNTEDSFYINLLSKFSFNPLSILILYIELRRACFYVPAVWGLNFNYSKCI